MTTLEQARRQFTIIPESAIDDNDVALDGHAPNFGGLDELRKNGLDLDEGDEGKGSIDRVAQTLRWRDVVLSGKLSQTRAKIKAQIAAHGGRVTPSVTYSTDFVVRGTSKRNAEGESAKIAKAKAYSVEIIDEDELRRRMKEGNR